jgi:hypothetical protein
MSNYHDEDGDFDQYVEYGEGFNIIRTYATGTGDR